MTLSTIRARRAPSHPATREAPFRPLVPVLSSGELRRIVADMLG